VRIAALVLHRQWFKAPFGSDFKSGAFNRSANLPGDGCRLRRQGKIIAPGAAGPSGAWRLQRLHGLNSARAGPYDLYCPVNNAVET